MLFFKSRMVGNRNLIRDLIGILLALAVGISGQLILSDPLRVLAPKNLPLLSPQDWPGSQFNLELLIVGGRPWQENRSFMRSIVLIKDNTPIAEATQTIVWYADLTQAAADWNQHKSEPYYDFPIVAKNTDTDKPASLLFCSTPEPGLQGECGYRAYWKHWYTQVTIYGGISKDFPLSEVQKLTDRIDQLLMSAPDKPCDGFFCNGVGNEGR
jgi:hypothetical protein